MSKVFIIRSRDAIATIRESLQNAGGYNFAKIIYRPIGTRPPGSALKKQPGAGRARIQETNRTLVICPQATVDKLRSADEYREGDIQDYNWDVFPMPKVVGVKGETASSVNGASRGSVKSETWDLHISGIPNTFTSVKAKAVIKGLLSSVLPDVAVVEGKQIKSYEIIFNSRSRQTDEIYGYGTVKFHPSVNKDLIKLCKLVLHHTYITSEESGKEGCTIRCIWDRVKTRADGLTSSGSNISSNGDFSVSASNSGSLSKSAGADSTIRLSGDAVAQKSTTFQIAAAVKSEPSVLSYAKVAAIKGPKKTEKIIMLAQRTPDPVHVGVCSGGSCSMAAGTKSCMPIVCAPMRQQSALAGSTAAK